MGLHMNIRRKVLLGVAALTAIPVIVTAIVIGYQANTYGRTAVENEMQNKLSSLREARQRQVENYITTLKDQLLTFATDLTIINAMKELGETYRVTSPLNESDLAQYRSSLQNYYTQDFVTEYQRQNLVDAPDMQQQFAQLNDRSLALQYQHIPGVEKTLNDQTPKVDYAAYANAHRKYDSAISKLLKAFNYDDIFLVDPQSGEVIYSARKRLDYTTSLIDGPYAEMGAGQAFRGTKLLNSAGDVTVIDYEAYLPSLEQQAMFLATSIFENNKRIGVLIFQIGIERINEIMTANQSWSELALGKSGEAYIVNSDFEMLNNSRLLVQDKPSYLSQMTATNFDSDALASIDIKNSSIGLQQVNTEATRAAINGESGFKVLNNYLNTPSFTAYAPFGSSGLNWAFVAEINQQEALSPLKDLWRKILWTSLCLILGIFAIASTIGVRFLRRQMVQPIAELETAVQRLAQGDMRARVHLESEDEFGSLAAAFNQLLDERFAALEQSEKQNEELNNSLIDMLMATMPLRDKDLTNILPVNEDVTGALADSMNSVTEEVARVLLHVDSIAQKIGFNARSVRAKALTVFENAKKESDNLNSTLSKLLELSLDTDQLAELSQISEQLAEDSSKASLQASQSAEKTVHWLGDMQETIYDAEKRIRQLGDNSREVNKIMGAINTLVEHVHMLALNTSMYSTNADEKSANFVSILEEIKQLTQQAGEAKIFICDIVENFRVDSDAMSETISKAVSEVIKGSRFASTASEQTAKAQALNAKAAMSAKQMGDNTTHQSNLNKRLREDAEKLQHGNLVMTKQLELQERQTKKLFVDSLSLLKFVGEFTLPQVVDDKTPTHMENDEDSATTRWADILTDNIEDLTPEY